MEREGRGRISGVYSSHKERLGSPTLYCLIPEICSGDIAGSNSLIPRVEEVVSMVISLFSCP